MGAASRSGLRAIGILRAYSGSSMRLPRSLRLLLLIGMAHPGADVSAQFTYVGADIGYCYLPLKKVGFERSVANRLELMPQAIYRFGKHIGVGAAVMVPATSKVKVTLEDSPTSDDYRYSYSSYSYGYEDDHRFSTLTYTAEDGVGGTLFARLYLEDNANLYFDARLSYARFSERLVIRRDGRDGYYDAGADVWRQPVDALDIDDRITHRMLVPGLSFGVAPHVGRNVYFNCYIGFDVHPFAKDAFSYQESYSEDYSGEFEYVTFASRLSGARTALRTGIGLGAHF